MTMEEIENLRKVRMGEVLEEQLKEDVNFVLAQKEWRAAVNEFDALVPMTKKQWLAFDNVESIFLNYSVAYGEAAYRLGFSDGIQIGMEQKFDERKSFLTLKDMTGLISVYDAIRQLKQLLLGNADEQGEEIGLFHVFEEIFNIIRDASSSKIRFLGEDAIDKIVFILNDETMKPEERAKKLLALD